MMGVCWSLSKWWPQSSLLKWYSSSFCNKLQVRISLSVTLWQVHQLVTNLFTAQIQTQIWCFQRLKMCSSLSTSRLILLISLSVVMLISVSGAEHVEKNCYKTYSNSGVINTSTPKWAKNIISCFEQNRPDCLPGYEVKTRAGRTFFLRPNTEWLKRKINEKTLLCPPVISKWWWWKRWNKSCRTQDPSVFCSLFIINSFLLFFLLSSSSSFTTTGNSAVSSSVFK